MSEDPPAPPRKGALAVVADLNILFELFVKIALMVGGVAAVIQYLAVERAKRVERTLSYASRFEEEPLTSAQQTLTDIFRDQHRRVELLTRAGIDEAGAAEEERRFADYLRTEANGTGVEHEIDRIVGFMNSVSTCVREDLCDSRVALTYFGPFADQFDRNLKYYVEQARQSGAPQYGEGLRGLAEAQRRSEAQ